MSKYKTFIFKDYSFDKTTKKVSLYYSYDNTLNFTETYTFDFNFTPFAEKILDQAVQLLFFLSGVSYFKMYLAESIVVEKGLIDNELANFLNNTYQKGLREFFYVNKLDILTKVNFPVNCKSLSSTVSNDYSGQLIAIGGGKDSLVSAELLRSQPKLATWSLNHRGQLSPLIKEVGLNHFWVDRSIDTKVIELNKIDAFNGHIPISSIFSAVGLIVAILSGFKDIVMSNENSANEASLEVNGISINHQYSKSIEYEQNFQAILKKLFGNSFRYYSLLRPLSELKISEIFAKKYFKKYSSVFSSCNRAFTREQDKMFWCGECSKCAFIFLALTPFIDRVELEKLWHGKNLLLDRNLEQTYKQLLGIDGDKPLDCVGEIKESRQAMRLAQKIYPELNKYKFDLPEDYDYSSLSNDLIPEDIKLVLLNKLKTI